MDEVLDRCDNQLRHRPTSSRFMIPHLHSVPGTAQELANHPAPSTVDSKQKALSNFDDLNSHLAVRCPP